MRRLAGIAFLLAAIMLVLFGKNQIDEELSEKEIYESIEVIAKEEPGQSDVDALKRINPDTVGIIEVGDVFLPLVKSHDNEEYLKKDFYGNDAACGCLFVSMLNKDDFSDPNTVIYGHNMRTGAMFGGLKRFLEESYLKDNRNIIIHTAEKDLLYRIIGVGHVFDGTKTYLPDPGGGEGLRGYLDEIKYKLNIYEEDILPDPKHILTLSTCAKGSADMRLAVIGVLEDQGDD